MSEIIKIIPKRPRNFAMVPNSVLRNAKATLEAKGLYCLMAGFSDGWDVDMGLLIKSSLNGRDAHYGAMRELKSMGLVEEKVIRHTNGSFLGTAYVINLDPDASAEFVASEADKPVTEMPHTDLPYTAQPYTAFQESVLYKEDNIIKKKNIEEEKNKKEEKNMLFESEETFDRKDVESVIAAWNAACEKSVQNPGLVRANSNISLARRKAIIAKLKDAAFRMHHARVFQYCATQAFYCGQKQYRLDLDNLLGKWDSIYERSDGFKPKADEKTDDDKPF